MKILRIAFGTVAMAYGGTLLAVGATGLMKGSFDTSDKPGGEDNTVPAIAVTAFGAASFGAGFFCATRRSKKKNTAKPKSLMP